MKTVIILQARMNSSRLPGKIALKLKGKTVLEHVVARLKTFEQADDLIVATTSTSTDDITCEIAKKTGVKAFRGSEENVLERYFLCAQENGADQIVRATADDPLTSIELLRMMYASHVRKNADYTCSEGFPVGVQEEIVSFDALQRCYELSNLPNHFEHVLEYIIENPASFYINAVMAEGALNRPDIRVTLDTEEDFDYITTSYEYFENTVVLSLKDMVCFWDDKIKKDVCNV